MPIAIDTVKYDPVGDAVKQLRLLDLLPDNIDTVQEVAAAVLRRSTLPVETVEFLISHHRRNRKS